MKEAAVLRRRRFESVLLPCFLLAVYMSVHGLHSDMIPVQNNHVDGLDDIIGPAFEELDVRQIIEAREIGEIKCKELTVTDHR